MKRKSNSYLASPYIIWSMIFIVIPLLLIIFFGFTKEVNGHYVFSLENFQRLMDPIYFKVFIRSLWLALVSTFLCILVGYPTAYIISKVKGRKFQDEEGNEIKNKYGYFKNALIDNINRFNNEPEDLWNEDEYDWLNDDSDELEL